MYSVKEIFYTLQGEGAQTGRAAVFCRFAGCNLWSGREADRASAICQFCDTDFAGTNGPGGGKFTLAADLAAAVMEAWPVTSTTAGLSCSPGAEPAEFEALSFRHFFLQPMDGPFREANTQAALRYCLDHPRWRLSQQTHKLLGIP